MIGFNMSKLNDFFKTWVEECKPDTTQDFFPVKQPIPTLNGVPNPDYKDISNDLGIVELEYSCCFK